MWPAVKAWSTGSGTTLPSIMGLAPPELIVAEPSTVLAGTARKAAGSSEVTPQPLAAAAPAASAVLKSAKSLRPAPDSTIALWNRPRALGDSIRKFTAMPPADSPKMVTLPGSPPKPAMLAFTHFRAAIMSMTP